MPGLSGVETAIRISDEIRCKVLFLTTMAADQDFREMVRGLRQQGCDCDALPKLFSKEELLDYVRHRVGTAHGSTAASSQASHQGGVTEEAGPDSHQTSSPGYASPEGDYDALLKISTVQLYQVNAFRITGLNVQARSVTLHEKAKNSRCRLSSVLCGPRTTSFLFPSKRASPRSELLFKLLRTPEQRLLHEMFWFWPCIGQNKEDPALRALQLGNYQGAVNIWTNAMAREKGIASSQFGCFLPREGA